MGKFKDFEIIKNNDSLVRIFKSKSELPRQLKAYLISQGYYLNGASYTLTEERLLTRDSLHFIGQVTYSDSELIYTIKDNLNERTMIIQTNTTYSFFQMLINNFLDDEYF